MFVLPRHSASCKIISRTFELATSAFGQTLPPVSSICHSRICQKRDIKTQGPQVVKVLKPMKVTSLKKNTARSSALKSKNERRQFDPHWLPDFNDEDYETYEDRLASTVSRYSSRRAAYDAEAEFTRSLKKELETVKHHTIRQKHFKPAPFPNLLTWAAKEQIRFLHRSNPEDWTMEALVEYFPVTEKSLKKLLKSKRPILQEEDVLKHDKQVLENWNNLHAQIESGKGTKDDYKYFFTCFFNSENNCLVANAVSAPDLPGPKSVKKPSKKGPLSMIVEDCLQLQEEATQALLKEKIPLVSHQLSLKLEDTAVLLENIASLQKRNVRKISPYNHDLAPGKSKQTKLEDEGRLSCISEAGTAGLKASRFNKGKHSVSGTYISSKTVYDENGEFLYRIP